MFKKLLKQTKKKKNPHKFFVTCVGEMNFSFLIHGFWSRGIRIWNTFKGSFTQQRCNRPFLSPPPPLYVENTAICRKKGSCVTPEGSEQLKIPNSPGDKGHISQGRCNRLWGQQGITYRRAGELWFPWWSVLSRASRGPGMLHANNNYLSEPLNCPENEYEPLQHRDEELQFLLNHFSMSWKRIAMIDALQWKNRSFWSSMHINKFRNCYPSIFIMI